MNSLGFIPASGESSSNVPGSKTEKSNVESDVPLQPEIGVKKVRIENRIQKPQPVISAVEGSGSSRRSSITAAATTEAVTTARKQIRKSRSSKVIVETAEKRKKSSQEAAVAVASAAVVVVDHSPKMVVEDQKFVSSDISSTSSDSGNDEEEILSDVVVDDDENNIQKQQQQQPPAPPPPSRKISEDSGIRISELSPDSSLESSTTTTTTTTSNNPVDFFVGGDDVDDDDESASAKITRNVEQIEALLKRINEENKKTKEVLDSINRTGCEVRETTTKIMLSKTSVISLQKKKKTKTKAKKNNEEDDEDDDDDDVSSDKSGSNSCRWEDMLFYETTVEGKKIPVVMFTCASMSRSVPISGSGNAVTVGQKFRLSFKTVNADAKLVSQICHSHGFHEVHSSNTDYNLMWTGVHPKPHSFKAMLPHQRVNHFPRSYELTRKDRLYQNIERLQHARGAKHFNFVPKTFMIPSEYSEFAATHHRMRGAWIVKPVASSRGRGIFIVNHPSQVPLDEPMVVAKYIDNPLLVNGHKWDLRLYVAVTSYDPLLIYLYEEGLVRFATVRYDSSGKNLWNPCMHLCNYSINKYHSDYIKCDDPDQEDQGHKWSLSALLRHLKANHIDTVQLMQTIEDVVIKSIISVEFPVNSACKMFVPNKRNCFELYGFDILIDSDLKPWLLEVNLSPSLNCDAPIDMKIKSAMICDLLNLIGLPAVDPVLKRAQFNRKMNEIAAASAMLSNPSGSDQSDTNNKKSSSSQQQQQQQQPPPPPRRTVSVETRRFAALRLAASNVNFQQELQRMVRNAKEENGRRGGWVRIFPTPETWANYGQLLEFGSQYNLILHEQLYPNAVRKAQHGRSGGLLTGGAVGFAAAAAAAAAAAGKRAVNGLTVTTNSKGFDFFRKRSQSAGPGSKAFDKMIPSKSTSSCNLQSASGDPTSSPPPPPSSSSDTARKSSPSDDDNDKENNETTAVVLVQPPPPPPKPTPCELRVAQYEKPLTKGHKAKPKNEKKPDPEKVAKRRSEKRQRSAVLRDKVMKLIEGGHQLSEYQARKAFSVYLHCLLQRLADFDAESNADLGQIDLILKFLQRAALSLRESYFLKAPSVKLSGKDRAAIVAKELSEFLGHYRRETEVFTVFREEPGMVPRHIFEEFVAFANDSDLEDVLTLQTKMYRCAHIFLGRCAPPPPTNNNNGGPSFRRNNLLRAAYGSLRERQCAMRANARANPPVAPQFQLPSAPPFKCLDITTYERSKLEELEANAEMEEDLEVVEGVVGGRVRRMPSGSSGGGTTSSRMLSATT